jgi:hypothetical protein
MIAGQNSLADLKDGGGALNKLMAAGGKWYYCNPTGGTGSGYSAEDSTNSLLTAYNLCRDGVNDGVIFIGGATAWNPAAAFTWSKSYTHLIGLSSDVPGLGQRCRIVALAATALSPVMTISGSGCVFSNIQWNNEKAAGAASGVVAVTGQRNEFLNCFFMAPTATDAASYSLKDAGAENVYVRCTIGQLTNPRTGASYGLWLHKGTGASVCRNKFIGCEFLSWGYNAGHVHVYIDVDIATIPWVVWFEDCLFQQNATALTQAIDDNSTATGHQVIFRGRNNLVVNASAVADTLTYMFCPDLYSTQASGLLAVTVAES